MPYSKARISIPNVTGNIVITATAVPSAPGYQITWNDGYKCGYSTGNADTLTADADYDTSDGINVLTLTTLSVTVAPPSSSAAIKIVYYNSSSTVISTQALESANIGDYQLSLPANTSYFRIRVWCGRNYYDWVHNGIQVG